MRLDEADAGEQKQKQDQEESMSFRVGDFLKKNLNKGELALKHAAGLGAQPNIIPESEPIIDGSPRPVEVGWHPVGGLAGKWFAEQTGLGKLITNKTNKYPDPTQHWAVLVGDFAHQLWMDENFDVIYTNERIVREQWQTFHVGETHFNDDATRRAGESVIQSIREKQPAYNLITNNCQTYALQLLDAIKAGSNKEFGTTLAVYERLIGPGRVKDLFVNNSQVEGQFQLGDAPHENTVSLAHQVMVDNTNQLDAKEQMDKSDVLVSQDDCNDGATPGVQAEQHGERQMSPGVRSDTPQSKTRRLVSRIFKK